MGLFNNNRIFSNNKITPLKRGVCDTNKTINVEGKDINIKDKEVAPIKDCVVVECEKCYRICNVKTSKVSDAKLIL
jgi:RNase P subunit RPR2